VDDFPVPVEQKGVGSLVSLADFDVRGEGRSASRRKAESREQRTEDKDKNQEFLYHRGHRERRDIAGC
jgi:hypothetical protein